ncbi:MAG: CxxC-x17-CxxC domain-containing protein [Patescibacteria group bacterium]
MASRCRTCAPTLSSLGSIAPFSAGGGAPWKRGPERDGERPALHDAICGDCGAACQVPFRPSGSRPVLCRNCFKKDDAGGDRGPRQFEERRSFSRPGTDRGGAGGGDSNLAARLSAIERKLDAILEALTSDDEKLF